MTRKRNLDSRLRGNDGEEEAGFRATDSEVLSLEPSVVQFKQEGIMKFRVVVALALTVPLAIAKPARAKDLNYG